VNSTKYRAKAEPNENGIEQLFVIVVADYSEKWCVLKVDLDVA